MTTIRWPALLMADPLPESFKEIEPNVTRRSQMSSGGSKIRRFVSRGINKYAVEFILNLHHTVRHPDGTVTVHDQRAIFLEFFRNTLRNGVRSFLFVHPIEHRDMEVRILPESETDHFSMGYVAGRLVPLSLTFEELP